MSLEYETETERHLINVLGAIYRQADWRGADPYVAFETAIMIAKNSSSAGPFIQKMCEGLGAGVPSMSIESINHIRSNWKEAIELIRTEAAMLTFFASKRADEMESEETAGGTGAGTA